MYKDKFILSVLMDGSPVKETGPSHDRQVAVPFDTEYKLRLKNKHDRSCTARVFIDGKKVSALGDIVVGAGGTVDLERFIDSSLSDGKRFKFVSLDHPDVDDPTDSNNGIIKVEFRLAKEANIVINPSWPKPPIWWQEPWPTPDSTPVWRYYDVTYSSDFNNDNVTYSNCSDNVKSLCSNNAGSRGLISANFVSQVENGATVEGSHSSQTFGYTSLEVEDTPVIIKLKMVGLKTKNKSSSEFKFCSACGNKMKRSSKYCSECGRRV